MNYNYWTTRRQTQQENHLSRILYLLPASSVMGSCSQGGTRRCCYCNRQSISVTSPSLSAQEMCKSEEAHGTLLSISGGLEGIDIALISIFSSRSPKQSYTIYLPLFQSGLSMQTCCCCPLISCNCSISTTLWLLLYNL